MDTTSTSPSLTYHAQRWKVSALVLFAFLQILLQLVWNIHFTRIALRHADQASICLLILIWGLASSLTIYFGILGLWHAKALAGKTPLLQISEDGIYVGPILGLIAWKEIRFLRKHGKSTIDIILENPDQLFDRMPLWLRMYYWRGRSPEIHCNLFGRSAADVIDSIEKDFGEYVRTKKLTFL